MTFYSIDKNFRCALEYDDLLQLLRQSGTSIEIPTSDQYECTVLFLWNRKKTNNSSTADANIPSIDNKVPKEKSKN